MPRKLLPPDRIRVKSPVVLALLAFYLVLSVSLLLAPQPDHRNALFHSILLQVFLVLGVPVALAKWSHLEMLPAFHLNSASLRDLSLSAIIGLAATVILDEISFLQFRLFNVSASSRPEIQGLIHTRSFQDFAWTISALAFFPAVCEELLFRGFILNQLLQRGTAGFAITASAFLFGLFHRDPQTFSTTTLAGVLLAFVTYRTGSVANAIVLHAAINSWSVLLVSTYLGQILTWTLRPSPVPSWILIGSAATICAGVIRLGRP